MNWSRRLYLPIRVEYPINIHFDYNLLETRLYETSLWKTTRRHTKLAQRRISLSRLSTHWRGITLPVWRRRARAISFKYRGDPGIQKELDTENQRRPINKIIMRDIHMKGITPWSQHKWRLISTSDRLKNPFHYLSSPQRGDMLIENDIFISSYPSGVLCV